MSPTPFPIDAVYMWVDGNDPEWQNRMHQRLAAMQTTDESVIPPSSTAAGRFSDNEELRYSLRSLEQNAPWINRVFIITDGQKPSWLNTKAATVVTHQEIFPDPSVLPVFSNRPIEFCQHCIPGLSEHFLAFNDDFMLGKPLKHTDFFTEDGTPIVWAAKMSSSQQKKLFAKRKAQNPHTTSVWQAHQLIEKLSGRVQPYKIKHYPRPLTLSTVNDLIGCFPEIIASTLASPFRTKDDISLFPLYPLYLLASGQGKLRLITGSHQLLDFFSGRIAHTGASLGDFNLRRKLMQIRYLKPQTFCINDAEHATEQDRNDLKLFFQTMFPQKSRFEA